MLYHDSLIMSNKNSLIMLLMISYTEVIIILNVKIIIKIDWNHGDKMQ